MDPITSPDLTEEYAALSLLTQAQLNDLAASIESYLTTYLKKNLEQLALDVFGSSYVFTNDGVQSLPTLNDAVAKIEIATVVDAPWTFTNHTVFTSSAEFDSQVTGDGQPRQAAYNNTSDQALVDSTPTTLIMDTSAGGSGFFDALISTTKFTITNGSGSMVNILAQVTFAASATGKRTVAIYKNGTKVAENKCFANDASETTVLQVALQDFGSTNDFYQVKLYQNSGGVLNVVSGVNSTYVSAQLIW